MQRTGGGGCMNVEMTVERNEELAKDE